MNIFGFFKIFSRAPATSIPTIPIITIEGWVSEHLPMPNHPQYKGMAIVRTFATELGVYDELDIPAIETRAAQLGVEMCPQDLIDVIVAHHDKHPCDWEGTKFPFLDDSFYLLNRRPVLAEKKAVA